MLVNNTINVYSFALPVNPAQYAQRMQLLSNDEVHRARRLKFDHHRMCWVSSRAMLRTILASHLDLKPQDLVFATRKNGKPVIRGAKASDCVHLDFASDREHQPSLHFNLSHSHEQGFVAVCKNLEIGCDIEHVKRVRDWPTVTRRFFSQAEQEELAKIDPSRQTLAFFLGWTRKEAVIKATGDGLHAQLDAFDVTLTPGEQALVKAHRHASQRNANWHLRHFNPHPDYVAAVAVDSKVDPDFVFHQDWSTGD